jgi:hypothetical protein
MDSPEIFNAANDTISDDPDIRGDHALRLPAFERRNPVPM